MNVRLAATIGAVSTMLAMVLGASAVDANGLEPPWINELVQDGENVEITINHTYLYIGPEGPAPVDSEEELTLVRYSEDDGSLHIVFERRPFTRESDGVTCGDWFCMDPDEEGCAEDPESCIDCDGDEIPECWGYCSDYSCESVEVDECVPSGPWTYALFAWFDEENFNEYGYQCGAWEIDHSVLIDVDDVGQDCPEYYETFECVDLPNAENDPNPGSVGCSVTPPRAAGAMTTLMLLLGLGGLLVSRIRRRR